MIPISLMWNGNNIGGSVKRGVGLAMQVGVGNCGGIISSFMYVSLLAQLLLNVYCCSPHRPISYRSQDAPRYYLGHGANIG